MKKENKQASKVSRKIWTSVLLAVLGIVLIVWPTASVSALVRLLGIALIVIGVVGVLQQAVAKDEKITRRIVRSVPNVLFAALGIWILINPTLFEGMLQFILGALILVFSLKDLYLAVQEKKHMAYLILAGVGTLLGILILINPFGTFRVFTVMAGIALTYTGITSLISEMKAKG